eukprot:TRINITY_DN9827_c0_g1_i1.p1 TRINITY_DN9827_c0_g1~~TRINITY_DN9827_c0_g1_i1.p1  ORF type:complete len:58 (-),score=3.17 TRINITY_DN9827_c0_g1_i1:153-326(-)
MINCIGTVTLKNSVFYFNGNKSFILDIIHCNQCVNDNLDEINKKHFSWRRKKCNFDF